QSATQPQQAQVGADGTAKFSTSTGQLIVEVVTVKDKSGKTIEGLTAQDFIVTENGVSQTVRYCDFQKIEDTSDPADSLPPPTPETNRPKVASVTRNQIAPEA